MSVFITTAALGTVVLGPVLLFHCISRVHMETQTQQRSPLDTLRGSYKRAVMAGLSPAYPDTDPSAAFYSLPAQLHTSETHVTALYPPITMKAYTDPQSSPLRVGTALDGGGEQRLKGLTTSAVASHKYDDSLEPDYCPLYTESPIDTSCGTTWAQDPHIRHLHLPSATAPLPFGLGRSQRARIGEGRARTAGYPPEVLDLQERDLDVDADGRGEEGRVQDTGATTDDNDSPMHEAEWRAKRTPEEPRDVGKMDGVVDRDVDR